MFYVLLHYTLHYITTLEEDNKIGYYFWAC